MGREKNRILFYRKKSHLNARLREDYIDNGIATVPCRVTGWDDVISPYSVKNYETLSPDFVAYVRDAVEPIPVEYPVVLNIVGHEFTPREQTTIRDTIEADFAYDLGSVEKVDKRHLRIFFAMLAGIIGTALLLWGMNLTEGITGELLFVVFWFFADTLVGYLFLDGSDLRRERLLAGRLACVQVEFSKEYDERDYTKEEAEQVYEKLEETD